MATTTPNYGWDVPTSTDYVKDGATAIETLGDDIDATLYTALGGAYPGLRLISKTTIGSAVAAVTVTSPFSATYAGYRIMVVDSTLSTAVASMHWQLAASGTQSSTGYSYGIAAMDYAANAFRYERGQNTSQIVCGTTYANGGTVSTSFDILNPFAAKASHFIGINYITGSTGYGGMGGGIHDVATSYNGFRVSASTGTMTGGTIYVYGYGAS
jgi:hypothetical protein